jgi:hypothetical protein
MSTEVETKDAADSETPAVTSVSSAARPEEPAAWRRRRYQVIAGAVAIALIAAFVGNNFLARQYSPAGAVSQYLGAIQRGNAAAAWSLIQVTASTTKVDASLIDRAALQAALSSGKPDMKSFAITSTSNASASLAAVNFSYETSSGTKQGALSVGRSGETSFGFYPVWHVVITPALLDVVLPKGSAGLSIDGKAVALPDGAKSTVAVLPLAHSIRFNGTQMLETQVVGVDAFSSLQQTVPYQPKFTSGGLDAARGAIKVAFNACAKSTSFRPDACPQTSDSSFGTSPQWQLVGDPLQDPALTFDADLNPVATGHFQMVISYQEAGIDGTNHWPSSGGYRAALVLTATGVTVNSIVGANDLSGLQRPDGATDQAAKDLITKAFSTCAAAKSPAPADCPERLSSPDATNVSWALSGDPLAGSTVAFDQASGLFTLKGKFSMTSTYYVNGYQSGRPSYTTSYAAYLFWDGQALHLVTISGEF